MTPSGRLRAGIRSAQNLVYFLSKCPQQYAGADGSLMYMIAVNKAKSDFILTTWFTMIQDIPNPIIFLWQSFSFARYFMSMFAFEKKMKEWEKKREKKKEKKRKKIHFDVWLTVKIIKKIWGKVVKGAISIVFFRLGERKLMLILFLYFDFSSKENNGK